MDFLDDGGEALGCDVQSDIEDDAGIWVQLRSNLGEEFMRLLNGQAAPLTAHGDLAPLIGKKVRVIVELIED